MMPNYPAPPVVPNAKPDFTVLTDQGLGDHALAVTGSSLGVQMAVGVLAIGLGALAVGIARVRQPKAE